MAAARVIQVVKAHTPLIKFHHRPKVPALSEVSDLGPVAPLDAPIVKKAAPVPSTPKVPGPSSRGSGIDFRELPKRYQRKPLDQNEIDVITRGGPE